MFRLLKWGVDFPSGAGNRTSKDRQKSAYQRGRSAYHKEEKYSSGHSVCIVEIIKAVISHNGLLLYGYMVLPIFLIKWYYHGMILSIGLCQIFKSFGIFEEFEQIKSRILSGFYEMNLPFGVRGIIHGYQLK